MRAAISVLLLFTYGCGTRSALALVDEADAESPSDASPPLDALDAASTCSSTIHLRAPSPTPATHATCLTDTSAFDASWALTDPSWCLAAHYELPVTAAMTWGRHGGPLVGPLPDGTLQRWSPPSSATGAMTLATSSIDAEAPAGMVLTSSAVDLPFNEWTAVVAISTTSHGADAPSAILLFRGGHLDARIDTHGGGAPIGLAGAGGTRLVFEEVIGGERPYAFSVDTFDVVGTCTTGACGPATRQPVDPMFASALYGVFADPDGNVFAEFPDSIRTPPEIPMPIFGYARERIAPGACPTAGFRSAVVGQFLPVADGQRIYVDGHDGGSGIDTFGYRFEGSGALVLGDRAIFVSARPTRGGAWFSAIFRDGRRRLWLAMRGETSTELWGLALR